MFTIFEEHIIESDVETVYRTSTDILNYTPWNPWCIAGFQDTVQGGHVDIKVVLANQKMKVRHNILEIVPNERFVWEDAGFFTLFSKGTRRRTFALQRDGKRILYRCELTIRGRFATLTKVVYKSILEKGRKAEYDALKETAEKDSSEISSSSPF